MIVYSISGLQTREFVNESNMKVCVVSRCTWSSDRYIYVLDDLIARHFATAGENLASLSTMKIARYVGLSLRLSNYYLTDIPVTSFRSFLQFPRVNAAQTPSGPMEQAKGIAMLSVSRVQKSSCRDEVLTSRK